MFLVALTGGIASGKSTVTKMFMESGLPVVDADALARKVVEPGRKAWKKLRKEFGHQIFNEDLTLNREKLAEIVFTDVEKRKKLNLITHPEITKEMLYEVIKLGLLGHSFIIMDIPLLFETGEFIKIMHKIIVVNCSESVQIERLIRRNRISEEAAKLRLSSQMPLEAKCEKADYVIDNSYSLDNTRYQVDLIIADLKKSKFHFKVRIYAVGSLFIMFFIVYYIFKK